MHNIPGSCPGKWIGNLHTAVGCLFSQLAQFLPKSTSLSRVLGIKPESLDVSGQKCLLSATNINCRLNGSLQSFRTTNVKSALSLEITLWSVFFHPNRKKEKCTKFNYKCKDSANLLSRLYKKERHKTKSFGGTKGTIYKGWNTEKGDK